YIRKDDLERSLSTLQSCEVRYEHIALKTMDGESVVKTYTSSMHSLKKCRKLLNEQLVRTYEADIRLERQFLMHHGHGLLVAIDGDAQSGREVDHIYINPFLKNTTQPPPKLTRLYINFDQLNQIFSCYSTEHQTQTLLCKEFSSRAQWLDAITLLLKEVDPDIILAEHIDKQLEILKSIYEQENIPFSLGRYIETNVNTRNMKKVHGRVCLDIYAFLSHVAGMENPTLSKYVDRFEILLPGEACKLKVWHEVIEASGIFELSYSRSMLTGMPLDNVWGSVAPFEQLYITELHQRQHVAPTYGVDKSQEQGAPGGLVMIPESGLYEHVFVLDFKSLYPSLIRTFNIDPLSYAAPNKSKRPIIAPNEASFARKRGILPEMLETFFAERQEAKDREDYQASYMYKIIMNSFYGVLGGTSRFADRELAGAITSFGHHFMKWTRQYFEEQGYQVLYGDTDSMFVKSGLEGEQDLHALYRLGEEINRKTNDAIQCYISKTYGVESYLELEFEKYYRYMVLPPARGEQDIGRAKGYAGYRFNLDGSKKLDLIGLEAIRKDWTDLAGQLQKDLLMMIFEEASAADIEQFIFQIVRDLKSGKRDKDLVYRKRLRKPVEAYTKTIPPHVKAAKLMKNPQGTIAYVVTKAGPQPVENITANFDYEHYIQKQILPIIQTLAIIYPFDPLTAITGQPDLFQI
ncbi:MAG: hypothetical protein MK193_00005, partial [Lentisphaeria bacterium]|nr:hypothetical protein [Lentisphaeria bacterium]